ncbi:MAG: hypothetical protein DCF30_19155 [Hyphomicrobiales bacterium]|nr:MAG: hypothetical protein DCF30_19155 [Hyphomicrobiales bacterium]
MSCHEQQADVAIAALAREADATPPAESTMKRALQYLGILGLATLLAGCDKCGNLGPFFSGPKTCSSSSPNG